MLATTKYGKLFPNKVPGVAIAGTNAGPVLRRVTKQLQKGGTDQTNWRHVFGVSRRNYTPVIASDPVDAGGQPISPTTIWGMMNEQYGGVLTPGPVINGVGSMPSLGGAETTLAYFTMVQSLRAAMGLPPLPTPDLYNAYLSTTAENSDQTDNNWGFITTITPFPSNAPLKASIAFRAQSNNSFLPIPPAGSSIGNWSFSAEYPIAALVAGQTFYDNVSTYNGKADGSATPTFTATVTGAPDEMTVTLAYQGPGDQPGLPPNISVLLTIATEATLAPGTYPLAVTLDSNIGTFTGAINVVVYSPTTPPFGVALSGVPDGVTATLSAPRLSSPTVPYLGQLWIDWTIDLSIAPFCPPAAGTIAATITVPGASATFYVPIAVTTGPIALLVPPPLIYYPNRLYCTTVYDDALNVTAFALEYTWPATDFPVYSRFNEAAPMLFMITASPAHSSSGAAPSRSKWQVISYNGRVWANGGNLAYNQSNNPDDILPAWKAVFGALPAKGKISFAVSPLDPITCTPGPELTCTATWENGTFKGSDTSLWGGHYWGAAQTNTLPTVNAPQSIDLSITVQAGTTPLNSTANPPWPETPNAWPTGYTWPRTFKATLLSRSKIPNGLNAKVTSLPAGLTITYAPETVTFNSDTDPPQTIGMTLAFDDTVPSQDYDLTLDITDGVYAIKLKFTLHVINPKVPPLPANFLGLGPAELIHYTDSKTPILIPYGLWNTGPDDIAVTMQFATVASDPQVKEALAATPFIANWSLPATPTPTPLPDATVTVPAATPLGPTAATPTAANGRLYFPNVFNAPPGFLAGQHLTATGYEPDAYNVTNLLIWDNDADTIDLGPFTNPGPMTQEGTISTSLPGHVALLLNVVIPDGWDFPRMYATVTASASHNTTTAYVGFTDDLQGQASSVPYLLGTLSPTPGSTTFTWYIANQSDNPLTFTLTPLSNDPDLTITFDQNPITIPPVTADTGESAAIPIHVSCSSNHGNNPLSGAVTATAPGCTLTCIFVAG